MTQVGRASRFGRVEVDVDNVIEGAHSHENGLAEFRMIDAAFIIQVLVENDRSKVTNRGLIGRCIQRNLGAKVGRVNDAHVVLR